MPITYTYYTVELQELPPGFYYVEGGDPSHTQWVDHPVAYVRVPHQVTQETTVEYQTSYFTLMGWQHSSKDAYIGGRFIGSRTADAFTYKVGEELGQSKVSAGVTIGGGFTK